jgi:hypothetical protein
MAQGKRARLSAQRTEVWCRWKAGQALHRIGRAFSKPHTSIHCLLSHHGGMVPAVRRRSLLVLTAAEREDIPRGLASGSSIRDIAKHLERTASTGWHALAAVYSIEPMKQITKLGSQPCGPSGALLPSLGGCRWLPVN